MPSSFLSWLVIMKSKDAVPYRNKNLKGKNINIKATEQVLTLLELIYKYFEPILVDSLLF